MVSIYRWHKPSYMAPVLDNSRKIAIGCECPDWTKVTLSKMSLPTGWGWGCQWAVRVINCPLSILHFLLIHLCFPQQDFCNIYEFVQPNPTIISLFLEYVHHRYNVLRSVFLKFSRFSLFCAKKEIEDIFLMIDCFIFR